MHYFSASGRRIIPAHLTSRNGHRWAVGWIASGIWAGATARVEIVWTVTSSIQAFPSPVRANVTHTGPSLGAAR